MTQVLIVQVEIGKNGNENVFRHFLQGCYYGLVCRINAEQHQCGERIPENPI